MAEGLFHIVLSLIETSREPAKLGEADPTGTEIVNMSTLYAHIIFFVSQKIKTSRQYTSLRLCPTNLTYTKYELYWQVIKKIKVKQLQQICKQ